MSTSNPLHSSSPQSLSTLLKDFQSAVDHLPFMQPVGVLAISQPDLLKCTETIDRLFEYCQEEGVSLDSPALRIPSFLNRSNTILSYLLFRVVDASKMPKLLSLVHHILDKGFNPNTQEHTGHTALHYAVDRKMDDVIRILLDAGAHPAPDSFPHLSRQSPVYPVHLAIEKGSLGALKLFSNDPSSFSILNHEGLSPLHLAIELGDFNTLRYCIEELGVKAPFDQQNRSLYSFARELHLSEFCAYLHDVESAQRTSQKAIDKAKIQKR